MFLLKVAYTFLNLQRPLVSIALITEILSFPFYICLKFSKLPHFLTFRAGISALYTDTFLRNVWQWPFKAYKWEFAPLIPLSCSLKRPHAKTIFQFCSSNEIILPMSYVYLPLFCLCYSLDQNVLVCTFWNVTKDFFYLIVLSVKYFYQI